MATTYLRLSISRAPIDELHPEYGAARLSITVESASNISDKIFVFQRHVAGGASGYSGEFFYSVAGLVDLANLPEAPSDSLDEPFYLSNAVTLDFATNLESAEAADKIMAEVALLVAANDRMIADTGATPEIVEFGTAP